MILIIAQQKVTFCDRMDETTFLLQNQNVNERANGENINLTAVTSLSGCEASLQKSEVHELQILLDKAQTLLENQSDENSAAHSA